MESAKWSRNLSANKNSEINRLRQITKQKIENKRNRNQTPMVTSTRSQLTKTIKSAVLRKPDFSESSDDSINSLVDSVSVNEKLKKENLFDQFKETFDTEKKNEKIDDKSEQTTQSQNDDRKFTSALQIHSAEEDNLEESSEDEKYVKKLSGKKRIEKSKSTFNLNSINVGSRLMKPFDGEILSNTNIVSKDINPLKSILNNSELLDFVVNPVPRNKVYQCTIIRDKKGIDRSFYPTYYMHLQTINSKDDNQQLKVEDFKDCSSLKYDHDVLINGDETSMINENAGQMNDYLHNDQQNQLIFESNEQNRQVFLLSGRRRKKSKTYLISCNPFEITRTNSIAKLKSNVIGTQFNTIRILQDNNRIDYATIIYDTNVLGFKGPRKMTVFLPKIESDNMKKFSPKNEITLVDLNKIDSKSVIKLKNKTPVWNEETQSYVLNFKGRVTQASVKNFQLEISDLTEELENRSKEDFVDNVLQNAEKLQSNSSNKINNTFVSNDFISMQFGRISNKDFTCDVSWPLSLLQAFSIALSSFDSKLACE